MRIIKYFFLFLLLQISFIAHAQQLKAYVDGQLRVKLTEEAALLLSKKSITTTKSGVIKTGLSSIDKISNNLEVVQFERLFPYNAKYDARHRKHGLHLWYTITYRSTTDAQEAVRMFSVDKTIGFAEPVLTAKLIPYKSSPFSGVHLKSDEQPFNDPYLPSQWHYNNTGQTGGTAGSDINLFEAWKLQTGKSNIIVSVHDQGVDFNHEDLAANMWVNEVEKNGLPGVDDDFNGYIDDVNGFNFRTMKGEIKPEPHGTHVAGTIAAVNNNGVGVSGVAGGSGKGDGARIMSCQILENANNARSFIYAADNGAVISQNSWGYTQPGVVEQSVLDAIDYFVEEAGNYPGSPMKGGVVIFAAGNDGADGDYYPGYHHNVVAVSATGPTNKISWFSNYGEWVDISAPGGDMSFGGKNGVLSSVPNNEYEYMEGTSMACPHISGVAALIASQFGGEGFTNDRLLAHLLTSVNDIYDINPNYVGKMGLGITDSRLALQANNGIAPVKIENITVLGAAQDFITLEWLAPADADDSNPVSYIVYYAIDNLDIDNLDAANKLTIKSKVAAGEKVSAELKNLLPVSTYKIAIKAFDRWGNASVLSAIVEAKTNDGPKASLHDAAISVTIDASINKMATDKFTLFNEDKGILRWKGEIRHSSQTFTYSKMPNFNNNTVEPMAVYKPNLGKLSINNTNTAKTKSIVDNIYITKSYFDWFSPIYVVGDEDLALPNSSATRFFVSEAEGFNLTHVSMWLKYDYALTKQPVIMQIFAGDKMENGNLVYEAQLTDQQLYSTGSEQYNLRLREQIFFESGTTFWIVFHSPAGNKYPLGVAYTQDPAVDPYGLMSFNLGKTWVPLKDVFGEPGFIWTTTAVSQSTPIHKYITLIPSSGEVLGNESKEIQLSIDASQLINGTYNAAAVITTNDANNRFVKLPISIEVLNQKPILQTEEIYNLGNVFMGGSKDFEIQVKNNGYGNFSVDYGVDLLTFDNPEFSLLPYQATRIPALDSATFKIRYTPSQLGNSNAVVTMLDKNGFTHKFNLFVAAVAPAKIEVNPNEANFDNVAIGDVLNGSIAISNTGNFPLKYFMPAFADGSNMQQNNKKLHKFGYSKLVEMPTVDSQTGETVFPASFVWNDISTSGIEFTDFVKKNTPEFRHFPVDLGFEFPFFGERISNAYLTSRGIIAFDTNSSFNNSPPQYLSEYNPNGMISAWGDNFRLIEAGNVYYKRMPGVFVVQYNGFYDTYDWMSGSVIKVPVELQMILTDKGDITFIYNKVTGAANGNQTIAIENRTHTDGLLITDYNNPINPDDQYAYISDGTVVTIKNPGLGIITNITNPFGLVQVGETLNLDYTIDTKKLYEGNFTENLSIISTDPFNVSMFYKINMNIVSGGAAKLELSATELNFGTVFQSAVKSETLVISNTGTKAVTINETNSTKGFYTTNLQLPLVLKAGQKVYAEVVMNTSAVNVDLADVLNIITDEVVNNTHTVTIAGKVELAPKIEVNIITDPTQTIVSSETAMSSAEFSVKNTGETDLTYSVEYSEWLYPTQMPAGTNFDYTWRTNKKTNNAPGYNWIDITKTGTKYGWKENSIWFGKIMRIEMPWAFNFFGTEYTTIRAAETGVVWFDAIDELEAFPPDYLQNGEIKNLIAPLWLAGGFWPMSEDDTEPALFYQAFDDYMVFSWKKMGNLFGMGDPIDFQMILYKNGNIKFQYSWGNDFTSRNGIVGYAKDGKYLEICNRADYLTNGTAILITPTISQTLAKGETMNHKLKVDARILNAGVFDNPLHIVNNTPLTGMVSIPATLTVTGAPNANVTNLFEYGSVMPYDTLVWGQVMPRDYTHEFEVNNTGTDVLSISNFAVENTDGSLVIESLVPSPWGGSYWDDVMNLWEPITVAPRSSVLLRARFIPTVALAGAYTNKLTIATNDANKPTVEVNFTATVVAPPKFVLNNATISVNADVKSHKETKQFVIDNTNGLSKLNYQMTVNFSRVSTAANVNTSVNSISHNVLGKTSSVYKGSTKKSITETFNRVLEYENEAAPATILGFGVTSAFTAATKFNAPDNGFYLSHFKTWFRPNNWLKSVIKYEIRTGATMADSKIVSTGEFTHEIPAADEAGSFITIGLQQPVLLFPNETFFVVVTYPLGIDFPQGTAELPATKADYFFYPSDGNWIDLTSHADFKKMAWMMKALEKDAKTGFWAELIGGNTGEIELGQSKTIDVNFDASFAAHGLQSAKVYFNTNDPVHRADSLELQLYLNQGPIFTEYPKDILVVNENNLLSFNFKVADLENNTFNVELDGTYTGVTLTKGATDYNVSYTPTFESGRTMEIKLKATDSNGYTNGIIVNITIVDVNRAPVAKTIADRGYKTGSIFDRIPLSSVFTDPDGDKLNYEIVVSNTDVMQIGIIGTDFILMPQTNGKADITLTATDGKSDKVGVAFAVFVNADGLVSVIENKAEIAEASIYPNPMHTNATLNMVLQNNAKLQISITDITGHVVRELLNENVAAGNKTVDISKEKLSSGMYLIRIAIDNSVITRKLMVD